MEQPDTNEHNEDTNNLLNSRIVDPANTNNILSDLLTVNEKKIIISKAKISAVQHYWANIVW